MTNEVSVQPANDLVANPSEKDENNIETEGQVIDGEATDVTDEIDPAAAKMQAITTAIAQKRAEAKAEKEKPLPDGTHDIYKGSGEDAELKEQLVIQNGMKNGVCKFYKRGIIKLKATYINDKMDGPAILYDKKGEMSAKLFYKNDKRHGVMESYKKGRISSMEMYENDKVNGVRINYNKQGLVKTKDPKVDGIAHGQSQSFDAFGNITKTCDYVNGQKHGYQKTYMPNGALKKIEEFREGLKEGKEQSFYPTGELKSETEFQNGKIVRAKVDYTKDGKVIDKP